MRIIRMGMLLVLGFLTFSRGAEILLGGFTDGGAPAIEKEFDRVLREQLTAVPHIDLVDYDAARNVARKIDLEKYQSLSRSLVQRLLLYIPDSTILVWGRIREYSTGVHRSGIFGSRATADLHLILNIYSLRFGKFAYAGDIISQARVPKGWIGLSKADRIVHITAEDRVTLNSQLIEDAVHQCANIISAVARSETAKVEKIETAKRYEDPSVAPVFQHPSVTAPALDSTVAADSAAVDDSTAVTDSTGAKPETNVNAPDSTTIAPADSTTKEKP